MIWSDIIRWLRTKYPAWAPVYEQVVPVITSEGDLVLEVASNPKKSLVDNKHGKALVKRALDALGYGGLSVRVELLTRRKGNTYAVLECAARHSSKKTVADSVLENERVRGVLEVFPEFTRIRVEDEQTHDFEWTEELVVSHTNKRSGPKESPKAPPEVTIYTDGSCHPNPGPGGWGAVLSSPGCPDREISGYALDTTNNRMEVMAAIQALDVLKVPCKVTVYTDSRQLQKAMKYRWYKGWQKNGWMTRPKEGEPTKVKNRDLWMKLIKASERHDIDWCWVRGHSGVEGNERADKLALHARRKAGRGEI